MKKLIYTLTLFSALLFFNSCEENKKKSNVEDKVEESVTDVGVIKISKSKIPNEYLEYLTPMITPIKEHNTIVGYKILFLLDEKIALHSSLFTKDDGKYFLIYKFNLHNSSNGKFVYLYNYVLLKENLPKNEKSIFEEFIKEKTMKVLKVQLFATNLGFEERTGEGTTTNEVEDGPGLQ